LGVEDYSRQFKDVAIKEAAVRVDFLISAFACILGVAGRCVYESRKRRGVVDTKSGSVIAAVSLAMAAFLGSWIAMCPADPLRAYDSAAMAVVGYAVSLAGLGLAVWGLAVLRGVENIEGLVTAGPFSRIRHPMYLGFALWIVGWVIGSGACASAVIAILSVFIVARWAASEERDLELRFGEEYARYRKRTLF
jgi:protein-S-isoprenylcysteine O-methyltransferase Ste14